MVPLSTQLGITGAPICTRRSECSYNYETISGATSPMLRRCPECRDAWRKQ
jgi:hypothetical protein